MRAGSLAPWSELAIEDRVFAEIDASSRAFSHRAHLCRAGEIDYGVKFMTAVEDPSWR